ncbi:MAG: outer membrane protein assembly factor BamD [Candidatus Dasytiphilus stammeri]
MMSIKYGILLIIVTLMMRPTSYFYFKFVNFYHTVIHYPVITETFPLNNDIKHWKKMQRHYQDNNDYQQTQLNLIYAYYKLNHLTLLHTLMQKFLRWSNFNSMQEYLLYMQGLTHLQIDHLNKIHLLSIDRYDRDAEYAERALQFFVNLIITYPTSKYIIHAKKYITVLEDRFAKDEFAIVKLNLINGAYASALKHIENMIINYPSTKYTHQAICLLKQRGIEN